MIKTHRFQLVNWNKGWDKYESYLSCRCLNNNLHRKITAIYFNYCNIHWGNWVLGVIVKDSIPVMVNLWYTCQRWYTTTFWMTSQRLPTIENNDSQKNVRFSHNFLGSNCTDFQSLYPLRNSMRWPFGVAAVALGQLEVQESKVKHILNFWHAKPERFAFTALAVSTCCNHCDTGLKYTVLLAYCYFFFIGFQRNISY